MTTKHIIDIFAVDAAMRALGSAERAAQMAAYMKTDQPFYGVPAPDRAVVFKTLVRPNLPKTTAAHAALIEDFWALNEREAKYLALDVAMARKGMITVEHLGLYERLIRESAWWDVVDLVATTLIGGILMTSPDIVWPVLDAWIDDDDMWIRRTAILAQNKLKNATDAEGLFAYCRKRAHEGEFFIRKAIGWALRSYSYFAPDAVLAFIRAEQDQLSGLSIREGLKQLKRTGVAL